MEPDAALGLLLEDVGVVAVQSMAGGKAAAVAQPGARGAAVVDVQQAVAELVVGSAVQADAVPVGVQAEPAVAARDEQRVAVVAAASEADESVCTVDADAHAEVEACE